VLGALTVSAADLGEGFIPIVVGVYGAMGSGTGVAIDALVKSSQVVYAQPDGSRPRRCWLGRCVASCCPSVSSRKN